MEFQTGVDSLLTICINGKVLFKQLESQLRKRVDQRAHYLRIHVETRVDLFICLGRLLRLLQVAGHGLFTNTAVLLEFLLPN